MKVVGTPNNRIIRHEFPDGTVIATVGNQYVKITVDKYKNMVPKDVEEFYMEPDEVKEFQGAYKIDPKKTMRRLKLTLERDKKTKLRKIKLQSLVLDNGK